MEEWQERLTGVPKVSIWNPSSGDFSPAGLSSFNALENGGRNAASTFYYHSELNSIISFGKYSLFERALRGGVVRAFDWFSKGQHKDKEGKDRRRQLLYYVSLIRACNKVLYQLVYIGKKVCIP